MSKVTELLEKIRLNALGCNAPCSKEIVHYVNQIIFLRNDELALIRELHQLRVTESGSEEQ